MIRIDEDKLTPFDQQVVNMARLMPDAWSLQRRAMSHPDLGVFEYTGYFLQLRTIANNDPASCGATKFRQLSWRGCLVLAREHRHMLRRVVPITAAKPEPVAAPLT